MHVHVHRAGEEENMRSRSSLIFTFPSFHLPPSRSLFSHSCVNEPRQAFRCGPGPCKKKQTPKTTTTKTSLVQTVGGATISCSHHFNASHPLQPFHQLYFIFCTAALTRNVGMEKHFCTIRLQKLLWELFFHALQSSSSEGTERRDHR